uniref:Uncharacterized protein n=1 Tax=Avena sativa TaxID=4498 RepID=A0ACD5Y0F9_AVESA
MMPYDDRYTVHIQTLGLLPFIHMVNRGTLHMNPTAITTLVDRWRLETHSFHLRTGKMTVTLQDMSMILALPIQGDPLCINTSSDNWRDRMCSLIGGKCPGDTISKQGVKLRVTDGATFKWISQNFSTCLKNASDDEVMIYARVYVWYVITKTIFPDGKGNMAHWHWLKALTKMDKKWS